MRIILFLILFLTRTLAASTDWLCTEESSQRKGSSIYACGIGSGRDENTARLNAFDNAKKEFGKVCEADSTCRNHSISVEPARTSCEKDKGYKCYRLIVFTIGSSAVASSSADRRGTRRASLDDVRAPTMADYKEEFTPFVYSSIADKPKVYVGMPKGELLRAFGMPESVSHLSEQRMMFFFRGAMCEYSSSSCTVIVDRGRVAEQIDFKPTYTDDLK